MSEFTKKVPLMSERVAAGEQPEILFWVGCAGSFDDRYKRVTVAFTEILNRTGIDYAVLGTEESCTGDPAKRARAIVEATTHFNEPEIIAEVSKGLGEPMVGINVSSLAPDKLMAGRGW